MPVSQFTSSSPPKESAIWRSKPSLSFSRGPCQRKCRHKWPSIVAISVIVLTCCTDKARCQLLKPPKKLHRVIAGFYALHPSYETDQRAPIATSKPRLEPISMVVPLVQDQPVHQQMHHSMHRLPPQESKKNAFHYSYHGEQDVGGDYNFHNIHESSGEHLPKHHTGKGYHRYKSSNNYRSKSKSKKTKKYTEYGKKNNNKSSFKKDYHTDNHKGGYTTGGFHGGYVTDWPYLSKIYGAYLVLAKKMAEYYGHKYHYPANKLYVSLRVQY